MTDEQQVTPERLEEVAKSAHHVRDFSGDCWADCPACLLDKAAEALREAHQTTSDAQDGYGNMLDQNHRLSTELEAQRAITDRLAEENRRLHSALQAVWTDLHNRADVSNILTGERKFNVSHSVLLQMEAALSTNRNEETDPDPGSCPQCGERWHYSYDATHIYCRNCGDVKRGES